MDIERALKNIGDWISKETESRKYPKGELLEPSESLQALKDAIDRQSVTDEDVQEAIEYYKSLLKYRKNQEQQIRDHYDGKMPSWYQDADKIDSLAITALQAYQPTISKTETVEEVAEAIEYFEDIFTYIAGAPSEPKYRLAITALQAYQPWIPCTERMPTEDDADEDGFVLTLDADRQQTDYPHSEIDAWNNRCDVKITHWRPMLPIPKGE